MIPFIMYQLRLVSMPCGGRKTSPILHCRILYIFGSFVITEALPGVLGNRGIRPFISGEQGNKSKQLNGAGEQRQFSGTRNIENQDFDSGEQGKMPIFQGNKGTDTSSPNPGRASSLGLLREF